MRKMIIVLGILVCLPNAAMAGVDEGLVAYYPFDAGTGTVAHDRSGNGNNGKIIGGAKWVKGKYGTALKFNGTDSYVDCEKKDDWKLGSKGTVMVWAKPEPAQGGLVTWGAGGGTSGIRLLLMVNTYYGGRKSALFMGDGSTYRGVGGFGSLLHPEWTHLAYTFDGKNVSLYKDGILMKTVSQPLQPKVDGASLWLGRGLAYGKLFFSGMLDDVRIYNRKLSAKEITKYYKKHGKNYQKDLSLFNRVDLSVLPYPAPAKIVARLDAQAMQPFPKGTVIKVGLHKPGSQQPIQQLETRDIPKDDSSDVIFDVGDLAKGNYVVRTRVISPDGAVIGEESSTTFTWPGRPEAFKNIKILNNFCWEMVNASPVTKQKYTFTLPYQRWVYIETTADVGMDGKVWVGIDTQDEASAGITHYYARVGRDNRYDSAVNPPPRQPHETSRQIMRFLKAGEHTVHLGRSGKAEVKSLVVRAIPAIYHAYYGSSSYITKFGAYDWDFQKKHLPHVNVIMAGMEYYYHHDAYERLEEWERMGRHWVGYGTFPNWMDASIKVEKTGEAYASFWAYRAGMQHPLLDGTTLDEMVWGDVSEASATRDAVKKLRANPKFKDKKIHMFCDVLYGEDASTEMARVLLKHGDYICWERYFPEFPTARALRRNIRRYMTLPMAEWERVLPGSTHNISMFMTNGSEPPRFNSAWNPSVDFKVCLDIQMDTLANDPAYFGLGGFGWWASYLCSEETHRWIGKLTEHYAIEGNTEMLSKQYGLKYELGHISNPDFVEGTGGWTLKPAVTGSIGTGTYAGYGAHVQGRFTGISEMPINIETDGYGDSFLLTRRGANKPNTFSQTIKNLTPGKLYSIKMLTSDYQDLLQGKSDKMTNAISINIDNVEFLTGPAKSFQQTLHYFRRLDKFSGKHPYWFNYHWRVFRAKGKTAKLTLTDWESDTEPGGPVGQELMFNFIEIQPYIEK
ncbi:MAG TPA: hypothetical protein ENH84_06775 [Phycisphaerae bacterium]|nr:hypothetical protein [Phycisphaerae bacterium]